MAVLLLSAGCRTVAARSASSGPAPTLPGPSSAPRLEKLDRYGLNGRVAVAAQRAGFLRQPSISSSSRGARISRSTGRWASAACAWSSRARTSAIATSRGETARRRSRARRARAAARVSQLPLAELRWWLLGIPAPGEASVNAGCGQRRDPRLHPEWLARQHQFARAGLGFALPQRLTAERERCAPEAARRTTGSREQSLLSAMASGPRRPSST